MGKKVEVGKKSREIANHRDARTKNIIIAKSTIK